MSDASRRKKHRSPVPPEEPPDPPASANGSTRRQSSKKWRNLRRTEFEKLFKNLTEFEEEVRCHLEDFEQDLGSEEELSSISTLQLQGHLEFISSLREDAVRKIGKLAKFCREEEFLRFVERADQRYGKELLRWERRLQEELDWCNQESSDEEEPIEPESPTTQKLLPNIDYWKNISQDLEKKIQKLENSKQKTSNINLSVERIDQTTDGANSPAEIDDACSEEKVDQDSGLSESSDDITLEDLERFIEESGVPYTPMSDEEAEELYEQLCLEFGIVLPAENLSSDEYSNISETRQEIHEEETLPDVETDVAEPIPHLNAAELIESSPRDLLDVLEEVSPSQDHQESEEPHSEQEETSVKFDLQTIEVVGILFSLFFIVAFNNFGLEGFAFVAISFAIVIITFLLFVEPSREPQSEPFFEEIKNADLESVSWNDNSGMNSLKEDQHQLDVVTVAEVISTTSSSSPRPSSEDLINCVVKPTRNYSPTNPKKGPDKDLPADHVNNSENLKKRTDEIQSRETFVEEAVHKLRSTLISKCLVESRQGSILESIFDSRNPRKGPDKSKEVLPPREFGSVGSSPNVCAPREEKIVDKPGGYGPKRPWLRAPRFSSRRPKKGPDKNLQ